MTVTPKKICGLCFCLGHLIILLLNSPVQEINCEHVLFAYLIIYYSIWKLDSILIEKDMNSNDY